MSSSPVKPFRALIPAKTKAGIMVNLMSALRQRIGRSCELRYPQLHINLDTTVETLYGNQAGGRKGHHRSHRGKKGYRPMLAFIEQTRACLLGRLRKAETLSGAEAAAFIHTLTRQLPEGTYRVLLRGDGEFLSWDSVAAASCEGFQFIFANKVCQPVFDHRRWYRTRHRTTAEYNSYHKATCFEGGRGFFRRSTPRSTAPSSDTIECPKL
jgi:hypothetical protein